MKLRRVILCAHRMETIENANKTWKVVIQISRLYYSTTTDVQKRHECRRVLYGFIGYFTTGTEDDDDNVLGNGYIVWSVRRDAWAGSVVKCHTWKGRKPG